MANEYQTGDAVPESGVYRVRHDRAHTAPHEVTCSTGHAFPPCRTCRAPHFELLMAAQQVDQNEHFRR